MSRPIPIEEMVRLFKIRHPTSHMFKIDNISLFKKYGIKNVESSEFELADHKWKLSVWPNGNNADGYVSIFLKNQVPVSGMVQYQLFIVNQLQRRKWHTCGKEVYATVSTLKSKGFKNFISLVDLEKEGYIIGDCCMFGVEFFEIPPAECGTAESFSLIEKPPNHKVTWKMTNFSSFNPEIFNESDEFVVGNRKWKIKVLPTGFMGKKGKSFSVYLSGQGFTNNEPKTKTYVRFKLRVLDQVNCNHVEKTDSVWFGEEFGFAKGFGDFMPLAKLGEPYLVKDVLYVGVEFELISVTKYL